MVLSSKIYFIIAMIFIVFALLSLYMIYRNRDERMPYVDRLNFLVMYSVQGIASLLVAGFLIYKMF